MGDVSSLFSTIGSGIGNAASTIGNDVGSAAGDLFSGAKDLVGNIGNGIGGVLGDLGGGGPVSPGTIANTAGGVAAPAASAGAAAPAAASGVAGFSAAPGIADAASLAPPPSLPTAFDSSITAGAAPTGAVTPFTPPTSPLNPGVGNPNFSAGGSPFLQSLLQPKTALPLGLLGVDLIKGSQTPAEVKQLQAMAAKEGGIANTQNALAMAGEEGILPAGGQRLAQETLRANEAAVRTKYAELGMSGSSAEAQDLQAARDQALASEYTQGQQIAQTGLAAAQAATGQQSTLLSAILAQEQAQGGDLASALAEFAAAAAK